MSDETTDDTWEHLSGIDDGCGCAEVWEHVTAHRDGD